MSEERRKQQQKRDGSRRERISPSRKMLIWGGIVVVLVAGLWRLVVLHESSIRWVCEMPGVEANEDVRAVLVSALRRAERDVRRGVSVCALCGVRDQRFARTGAGVQGGQSEVISELAVWHESAERRSAFLWKSFAIRPGARCRECNREIGLHPMQFCESNRFLFALIAVLALAGIVVSAVSLQRHYAKSASAFCDFGERFNCDIVNRSEYSTVMGIPVAGIGVAGYGVLFALATFYRSRTADAAAAAGGSLAGLAFALYLTYIEAYVLETWCILCLSSLALIAVITVAGGVLVEAARPAKAASDSLCLMGRIQKSKE